jgi:hypothetical protein
LLPRKSFYLFVLTLLFLLCIDKSSAYAIQFVTQEDFASEYNAYKDYPLRLLFKKLAESDDPEKREIRNIIILKQVFDPSAQKKDAVPGPEYQERYGIIKEISKDRLRIWVPENDTYMDYYLGIDQIPTEKNPKYKITESNIGRYTAFIYAMDERVYKIKIDFLLASPINLYVDRKDDKNVVGWSEPGDEERPYRYRIFRNGELIDTVEGHAADVPREKGKADNYFVKAVYKHGDVLLESEASEVIRDEITLKELEQERLAGGIYDRIIASLTPEAYEDAKKLLNDNRQLLVERLDQDRKENIKTLISFFQDIEEGDRLGAVKPETQELFDNALTFYRSGEQKAKALPAAFNVLFLAAQKIDLYKNKKALMAEARLKEEARLAEEARVKEEARLAEETRLKEEARLAEEARLKEEARLAEETRLKEEARLAEEAKVKEEARLAEEAKLKEETRVAEETRLKEEARVAEEARLKEEARLAEEARLSELKAQAAKEEERLKELAAQKAAATAPEVASKESVVQTAAETQQPEEGYDRDTMILLAMKDFDDKKYTSSWDTFRKIFGDQINKIGQGGKNQVIGVLALPVECRAEIFFLIELDKLKNSNDGNGITERGLQEIKNRIDNKEGLWVIMGDSSKIRKIKRHISQFEAGSFE